MKSIRYFNIIIIDNTKDDLARFYYLIIKYN